MSKNTWVYLYGDECYEIWEHFGFDNPNPNDRLKLKLIDYGFVYHKDPLYPLDDITWFLLEK